MRRIYTCSFIHLLDRSKSTRSDPLEGKLYTYFSQIGKLEKFQKVEVVAFILKLRSNEQKFRPSRREEMQKF